jgi:hypothetical protein
MKTRQNNFARASALQIIFSVALILVSAILMTLRPLQPDTRQLSGHVPCAKDRHDGYA